MQTEDTQTLVELGCTEAQAKVYLCLARLETAKASEISEVSKMHRQEVYRVLTELQEKSLVEKIITSPISYHAIPVDKGLPFLLERKASELKDLQQRVNDLVKSQRKKPRRTIEGTSQYRLIPHKASYIQTMKAATDRARKEIDIICSNVTFSQSLYEMSDFHFRAMRRGVKFRVLNYPAPNSESLGVDFLKNHLKEKNFEYRILTGSMIGKLAIHDRKEVYIPSHLAEKFAEHPHLWSNNRSLVGMLANYFDLLWERSTPVKRP